LRPYKLISKGNGGQVLNYLPVGNYQVVYVRFKFYICPSLAHQHVIHIFIGVCFTLYLIACSMNEYKRVRLLAGLLLDFPYGFVFSVHVMSLYINGYAEDLYLCKKYVSKCFNITNKANKNMCRMICTGHVGSIRYRSRNQQTLK
jgi:hypothetical protein